MTNDAERVSDIVERLRADAPALVRQAAYQRRVHGTCPPGDNIFEDAAAHSIEAANIIEAQSKALAEARVEDHKWFDPVCHHGGCRSLILSAALKRLSFAAQTTGGTAGPDTELMAAIAQAEQALTRLPVWSSEDQIRAWEAEREALTAKIDAAYQGAYDKAEYCGGGEP